MDKIRHIHDFVKFWAQHSPEAIAVVDNQTQMTYQELDEVSDQICKTLQENQIVTGDLIAVHTKHKTTTMIAALLGILKSGAAYAPISASLPKMLHQDMIKSIKPTAIISDRNSSESIPVQSLFLQRTTTRPKRNRQIPSMHEIAYVMYTSGTTGKPKGVPISHKNLIATYRSWKQIYALHQNDRHLQMADYCFDVFSGDWIRALCSGASLFLYPKEKLIHPESLFEFIDKHSITVGEFVPAILKKLTKHAQVNHRKLSNMRVLICGSDTWNVNECLKTIAICPTSTKIFNSYGLTETTIDSCFFDCENLKNHTHLQSSNIVPIGQALPHVQTLLLNHELNPVEHNEIGELFIGGDGVSPLGYLENQTLTDERFITLAHNEKKLRFYRTGDQAKQLSNGDIQFCGRNDLQTNIHGKRVDLLTTEAVISRYPGVEQCVVIAKRNNSRNMLHAFLTVDATVHKSTLVSYLKERLPAHYIPHYYYATDHIPLTRNGKIDRDFEKFQGCALPDEFIPPCTSLERTLVGIWQKHMSQAIDIGTTMPFCCVQKKALDFARMIAEINKRYNVNIKPRVAVSTIKSLCHEIQNQQNHIVTRAPLSSIAIIGGGPAAISLCHSLITELIKRKEKHVEITVYEKNESIGRGIPYQHKEEDAYILNLPSKIMALGNNLNQDFHSWYQQHFGDKYDSDFPPRHIFGEYITDIAHDLSTIAKGHDIHLKYVTNTEINKVKKLPNQQEYCLIAEHAYFTANFVVFCTGHMSSGNYRELIGISGYRHNSWAKHVRRRIGKTHPVAILGTRISAIDLVMKLKSSKHKGKIALFSRSGLLPSVLTNRIKPYKLKYLNLTEIRKQKDGHGNLSLNQLIDLLMREISEAEGKTINFNTIVSSHKQLHAQAWLEKEIARAESDNKQWQQILLTLYPIIPEIWSYLSIKDKQIFVRKYHSLFLTYLAGFPLENARKLLKWIQSGSVEIYGGLKSVTHENKQFSLTTDDEIFTATHLFNATGPGYKTNIYPLFHDLERTGLSSAHPCGGLKVDTLTQELINDDGKKSQGLYAIGELTRGEFWATTDMGQVNAQCQKISPIIINHLKLYQRTKNKITRLESSKLSRKTLKSHHEVREK